MQTLIAFNEFVTEINQSNSRNYKLDILKKYRDNDIIKKYLFFIYNPYITTGISNKKIYKILTKDYRDKNQVRSVFDLLDYITNNNTGTDADISVCQRYLSSIGDPDIEDLLICILTKNIQLGIDILSINKIFDKFIPAFNVQLANKYFDNPEYVEGKKFTLTTKIDGGRIIAIKKNGEVTFYTRAGQLYEGLVDLEQEFLEMFPDNICLDGEITLLNPGNLKSKEQYKETMKIVRRDGEKHGVRMLVFDMLPADDFLNQSCSYIYEYRRAALETLFSCISPNFFSLLNNLYTGTDTNEIQRILNAQIANGEEGIMINICDAMYEFKRSKSLLKVKKFKSCDLRVIDMERGTNKNSDRLGAFICEYKNGNTVKVGSGMSYEQRLDFWNNKDKYIGRIIEVSYFEETSNADGGLSLRFPTFKDARLDKNEPNF